MSMQADTRIKFLALVVAVGAMATGTAALAHPLQGAAMQADWAGGWLGGLAHPFLGVDHLLAMLAVGLWAAQLGGRWRWLLPLGFVSAMGAGGWMAQSEVARLLAASTVEQMVASSVLVLGLLIASRARLRAAGFTLVALFAVFHGMAHVLELPSGDLATRSLAGHVAGFLLATMALHAAGVAAGNLFSRIGTLRLAGIPIAIAGAWLVFAA